jgi:hydroxyacylglutathione hydrolase
MLSVLAVPAFQDNYLWLIHDGTHAAVVDPGDATPILDALSRLGLSLCAILLTHHHGDHAGGVPALLAKFPVPVHGPRTESIPGVTHPVGEGDAVEVLPLGMRLSVLDVPGHTRGHVAYVVEERNWLFCGDTLFAGGCGRLFEGTPAQMMSSLAKLAALPDETQVYCAHEYTLSNLRFALAVEPANQALQQRFEAERAKRDRGVPTVPSSLGLEKATNPFLRHSFPEVIRSVADACAPGDLTPVSVFAALREWKNSFR